MAAPDRAERLPLISSKWPVITEDPPPTSSAMVAIVPDMELMHEAITSFRPRMASWSVGSMPRTASATGER